MSKIDFERMSKMSSWATCNASAQERKNDDEHANSGDEEDADLTT